MNDTRTERTAQKRANEGLWALGQMYHKGLPLDALDAILTAHGFWPMEPAIYCGRDGRINEQVGNKTWLSLSWHKMDETGRYEVVAYLS